MLKVYIILCNPFSILFVSSYNAFDSLVLRNQSKYCIFDIKLVLILHLDFFFSYYFLLLERYVNWNIIDRLFLVIALPIK